VPIESDSTQAGIPVHNPEHSPVSAKETYPTASIVLIGNELLSGRTQDINLAYMAKGLAAHGIRVREARIIADDQAGIVDTLNTLRSLSTYVFTTGGIGPTHDDITADCIARAFQVDIGIHAEAKARLTAYWSQRGIEPNEDRLRCTAHYASHVRFHCAPTGTRTCY